MEPFKEIYTLYYTKVHRSQDAYTIYPSILMRNIAGPQQRLGSSPREKPDAPSWGILRLLHRVLQRNVPVHRIRTISSTSSGGEGLGHRTQGFESGIGLVRALSLRRGPGTYFDNLIRYY